MKFILLIFATAFFSCSHPTESITPPDENSSKDNIVEQFIYGLWSMDSGNTLYNEGFFFKPDGSVDFIASESSGTWSLSGKDSIKISYPTMNEMHDSFLRIDSISDGRMLLTDESGTHLFRKVPFGMNNEGNVLQGFAGHLKAGEKTECAFEIPPARKISLKLKAPAEIAFRVFDKNSEITSVPVKEWTSIMITGGKYKAEIVNTAPKKSPAVEYDLKVIAY